MTNSESANLSWPHCDGGVLEKVSRSWRLGGHIEADTSYLEFVSTRTPPSL